MILFIRQWLTGITCAALAASLAEELMPKGAVKQVGRLVCGLMVLWAAAGPVVNKEFDLQPALGRQLREQTLMQQEDLEQRSASMLKTLIERETAAYIVDKAGQSGVMCRAEVICAAEENGSWMPWSARIIGTISQSQRASLSRIVAEELGIPPDRQQYTGGEQS